MTFDPQRDHEQYPTESMQQAALRLVRLAHKALTDPPFVTPSAVGAATDALDGALYYLEQTVREPEDTNHIPEDRAFEFNGTPVDVGQFIEDQGFAMPDIEQIAGLDVGEEITYHDGLTGVLRRTA